MEKKEKHSQYFEAVLQFRGLDTRMIDFVHDQMDKSRAFVSKTKVYKDGIDMYISSNKFARKLGQLMVNHFGGELKVSEKLHTRDHLTSKDKYRLSVFFRPCSFRVGDVIIVSKRPVKITSISKKGFGIDLENGKKVNFDYRKKECSKLEVFSTRVCRTSPFVSVLHPETFEEIKLENHKSEKVNEKLKIVIFSGSAWRV